MNVICAFTEKDAEWAAQYVRRRQTETTKILAPTIQAQLKLREKGLPPHDYFSKELYRDTYQSRMRRVTELTNQIRDAIFKKLHSKFVINNVPLLDIFETKILFEVFSTCCVFDMVTNMERSWKPKHYFISASTPTIGLTGTTDPIFPLTSLLPFFVSRGKIQTFQDGEYVERFQETKLWLECQLSNPLLLTQKIIMLARRKIAQKRSSHLTPADILFFSFGFNLDYYASFFSLLREKKPPFTVCILTGSQPLESEWLLRRHNIPFTPLSTLSSRQDEEKIREEEQIFRQKAQSITRAEIMSALPKTIPRSLRIALATKMIQIIQADGPRFVRQTTLARKALRQTQPKLLLTTHDPAPSPSPFIYLAKRENRTTLALLHGVIGDGLMERFRSDHIAVWGPQTKKYYELVWKKSSSTVHPVGFPLLDPLFRRAQNENIPIPQFGHPIRFSLLLSQYLPDSFIHSKFLDEIFSIFSKNPQHWRVCIRLHRDQPSLGIKDLARFHGLNITFHQHEPLESFVEGSDIMLANDTTAILWPMIFRKPLYYTTPWWGSGYLPVGEFKAAWVPRKKEEFSRHLHALIKDPTITKELWDGQKAFLKNYVGGTDGKSSKRLLSLVKRLLSQS